MGKKNITKIIKDNPQLEDYSFPKYGITIRANSMREAISKLNEIVKTKGGEK